MKNQIISIAMMMLGSGFAIHCSRAALREFRDGVAADRFNTKVLRKSNPIQFWIIVAVTGSVGFACLLFALFGAATFIWNPK